MISAVGPSDVGLSAADLSVASRSAVGPSPIAVIANPANRGSFAERIRRRFASFHREQDGQILPLIFFLAIAFFIGVGLVINTGKIVNRRIESQNAVDAGAVSGVTTVARGMNYLARNNVTMTQVLASIILIRSLEPAIEKSQTILEAWRVAAEAMLIAGKALVASGLFAGLGVVLQVAGGLIKAKVRQELYVLKYLLKFAKKVAKFWDNKIESGPYRGAGNGWGWKLTKCLSLLGDVLAYATPVLAQLSAMAIHGENVGHEARAGCFMIPLYARLPACKGTFNELEPGTSKYVSDMAKYVYIAGWVALTLSFFPLTYKAQIELSKFEIFPEGVAPSAGGAPLPPPPADQAELEAIAKEVTEINDKIGPLQKRVDHLNETDGPHDDSVPHSEKAMTSAETKMDAAKTAWDDAKAAKAADADAKKDAYQTARKTFLEARKTYRELKKERDDKQDEIDKYQKRLAKLNQRSQEITDAHDAQAGSSPPGDGGGLDPIDVTPLPVGVKRDIHPYVVDDGGNWEKAATYFAIGYRSPAEPLLSSIYKAPAMPVPGPKWLTGIGFTYTAARLFSPSTADIWTADWRAKLVRADLSNLPSNPFGSLPATCAPPAPAASAGPPGIPGAPGKPAAGKSGPATKPDLNFEITVYGDWKFNVGSLIPKDVLDNVWNKFDSSFSITLPSGPGAVGKH